MCIIIRCRVCHQVIPTTSLTRTVCDNPECRKEVKRQRKERRSEKMRGVKVPRLKDPMTCPPCKVCGKRVPTIRRSYCSPECAAIAKKNRTKYVPRRAR